MTLVKKLSHDLLNVGSMTVCITPCIYSFNEMRLLIVGEHVC